MHSIVSLKVNNILTKGKLVLSNAVHHIHVLISETRVSHHVYNEVLFTDDCWQAWTHEMHSRHVGLGVASSSILELSYQGSHPIQAVGEDPHPNSAAIMF